MPGITQTTSPQGTVSYGYDLDSRRQTLAATPAGQSSLGTWTSHYDSAGLFHQLDSPTDGSTVYTYDNADRLTQKVKGNGEYETYAYDTADQLTGLGYYWADTTLHNSLTYGYDSAGNVNSCNQGYYATTYGYDGADQLVSETSTGTNTPPSYGYTYDHNGNRLTQTQNGVQIQSFTYNSHDMLATGTAGNESDGYDLNGSETSLSIYGGVYHLVYDDADRLTSFTTPGNVVDTFTYNGLGLRVGKTDSTGTYSYLCDGTTPGSAVLSDGHAVYTPGLSERRGGVSSYYDFDQAGNLWTVDGAGKSQVSYQDNTGFGTVTAGTPAATPFQFGGGNGCQSDKDSGLVLMGHRYYDTRIGRFISQDPAGSGDNWYAYADNNPVNEVDPAGLMSAPMPGQWSINGGDQTDFNSIIGQVTGELFSSKNMWAEVNHLWLINVSPGVRPGDGQAGYDTGSEIDRVNWAVPQWTQGAEIIAGNADPQHQPESIWHYFWRQLQSGGQADGHHLGPPQFGGFGTGGGGGHDPEKTVDDILKGKKGSIKNAPLEKGSPSWAEIGKKQWKEILKGAKDRQPGYDTFRKLLTDRRFNK